MPVVIEKIFVTVKNVRRRSTAAARWLSNGSEKRGATGLDSPSFWLWGLWLLGGYYDVQGPNQLPLHCMYPME